MSSTLSPCPNVSCESEEYNDADENTTLPSDHIWINADEVYDLRRISFVFEIISVVVVSGVLALSAVRTTAKTSIGPKLFAVNLLAFNLLYCVSSLLTDMRFVDDSYTYTNIYQNTVVEYIIRTDCIRSLALLVFNASYEPLLAMFILACLRPWTVNARSTSAYYAGLVLLSDVVPIVIQVVNVLNPPSITAFGLGNSWGTNLYAYSTFTLYVTQVSLMIVSMWVVTMKSKQLSLLKAIPAQTLARRKELVKALYFAVGPCLIQLPIAIQLVLFQVEKALQATNMMAYYRFAEVMHSIKLWVHVSRAITPIVDALSILLFLGDYRRNARTVLRNLERLIRESLSRNNSVEQLPSNEAQRPNALWRRAPASYGVPYFSQSHGSYNPRHTSA